MFPDKVVHLHASGVSLLLWSSDDTLPAVAHWGARIEGDEAQLITYLATQRRRGLGEVTDLPVVPSVLPEHARGWMGRPGIAAHRAGAGWAPAFTTERWELDGRTLDSGVHIQAGGGVLRVHARDAVMRIGLDVEIELTADGLLRTRARVHNESDATEPLEIQSVQPALRIPAHATEQLDFAGRWATEKIPQRRRVAAGVHARESRRGRTGLDATTLVAVGEAGFDARHGQTWLCHVGIGGDHEHAIERTDGVLAFRGAELLWPGEIRLGMGESYESPWVYGSYGDGWDAAAARFHAFLRARSRSSDRPRPVTLNIWEAVYFDQDLATLAELADSAADLGIERYVVDDGWFRGRTDDRRGLGDWSADPERWPDGLGPLAEHVRARGMEFGLWVEPEMINEDSDLARAHPDWILRARPELPPLYRFQQVLDLTNPEAFAHILEALDRLIVDLEVAYLKWDHNRDLIAAGHPATGAPAVHEQTLATYRLMDELRRRHPHLEIESCASGGGRVDLGILERTDRVHTSDNHDPLDRARILRWTGLLVPPEMLGSHVASARSEATGRTHDLHTRCAIAFLGHFGVEWDVRTLDDGDRRVLAEWIALYKQHRELIRTGTVVGGGDDENTVPVLRGVVGSDAAEAVYTIVTPALSADSIARVRLPGLDPRRTYRVTARTPDGFGPPWTVPDWLAPDRGEPAPELPGSLLGAAGLDVSTFNPERAVLVHARAIDAEEAVS